MRVGFDDERVISDAGVMLVATLAGRLGVEALAAGLCGCGAIGRGAANGRRVMALVYAMVLGADSIDDTDVLRAGRARRLLGAWIPAPATLGTFLCAFTFGHVRQYDNAVAESFFATLKKELVHRRAWPTRRELTSEVFEYIEAFYNRTRRHFTLGYLSPADYENTTLIDPGASLAASRLASPHQEID